jgi:hypothetical protein
MVLLSIGLGSLGGAARAFVGLLKAMRRHEEIHWGYTAFTIIASAVIGGAAGVLFDSDPKVSVIAGYVGLDLLESIYKITFGKSPVTLLKRI